MELTKNQINELKKSYEGNKEDLKNLEMYIRENGITDDGLSDVTESFEQGYNNAMEFVFSILNIGFTEEPGQPVSDEEELLPDNFNPDDYTIEYCPYCNSEQVIYAKGITACPECETPLAPCSMCEDCDYDTCPYGCSGGEADEHKEVTNQKITKAQGNAIYKHL